MNEVMGSKEDGTKYITIFRDPVDLFESAWGFYSFETKFGISLGDIIIILSLRMFLLSFFKFDYYASYQNHQNQPNIMVITILSLLVT